MELGLDPANPRNQRSCSFDASIVNESYYHGLLPREDIRLMLHSNGDFLIRTTEPNSEEGKRSYVLSIMVYQEKEENGIKHYVIHRHGTKWVIEKYGFDSIKAMVDHHRSKNESISKNELVLLKHPIPRQPWELSHDDIVCTKKLGEGAFGEVYKGTLKLKGGAHANVAIKLAKLENLTKEQIKEVMGEARLMRRFDHPNVVKFYGVAAGQEPLMVLMELVDCGALDSYLKKAEQPPAKKTVMCVQAAWGIEYLHLKNVIHRDIAARNCLYGGGQVKISDFGLSVEGTVYQMDPQKRVPVRWLAPETLRTFIYTQKTDVWAFGILCWEIFSNGQEPYPGLSPGETFVKVKEGYRMPMPACAPPELADLVVNKTWSESPNDRLSMKELAHKLELFAKLKRPQAPSHSDVPSVPQQDYNYHEGGPAPVKARRAKKNQHRKKH